MRTAPRRHASSDGHLLPTIDRSLPFRLTAWSDMEGHTPSFYRVAGLLLKRTVMLDAIAGLTGVDETTAAHFGNASYRCGLLAPPAVPRRFVASGFALGSRDLVAKLRQRLGL